MSVEFKNLLTDILMVVEPFRDEIPFVLMKRTQEQDIALAAKSKSGSIRITARSHMDVPDFEGVACLGSLQYLSAVLNSPQFKGDKKEFEITQHYETATDGKTHALRYITFKGGRKMEVFYEATDPFVNRMNKIKPPKIDKWPITFNINEAFIKDFNDITKVHRASPRLGGDRDDVFTMLYSKGQISAVFGEKSHQSTMILTDDVTADEGIDTHNDLYLVNHFQTILKLVGKNKGVGKLAPFALRVDTSTEYATYSILITAKKRST